ncbi:hypothetical protein, partial [Phenylobacterium sp.]
EALLWAREDYAKQFRSRRSHVADSILSGFWDGEVEVRLPAHGYRAGQAAAEARIKELEAALEKANKPRWFYVHDDEDASPFDCAYDAVDHFLDILGHWDGLAGQSEVIQIQTGRLCADIWVAARVFSEEEREARDDGEWFEFTEHASREEAEAALKGGDA